MTDVTTYFKSDSRRTRSGKQKAQQAKVDVRTELVLRSSGRCELNPLEGGTEVHHRLRRSQGGRDTVDNCVLLSPHSHHAVVHANPEWSYRHGWLLRSGDDPAVVLPFVGCGLDCKVDHR